ncbi:MAG: NAD kinase [bacterium]
MKIALFGIDVAEDSTPYVRELTGKLEDLCGAIFVYEPFFRLIKGKVDFRKEPVIFKDLEGIRGKVDMVFSIGGDGTILSAVALVRESEIPIMGINLGHLGFLSSISREEIVSAMDAIFRKNYRIDRRTLLTLESPAGLFGGVNFAMNDLIVHKTDAMSMLTIKTWVNGEFLNTYWADGLIVATPTGSTAYSLSCTGPVLTPRSENFVITPIASHNLTVRPVVIRDDSVVRIKVEGRGNDFLVSLDSRVTKVTNAVELTIRKAQFGINLLRLTGKDFFTTLREKLNWGLDIRN